MNRLGNNNNQRLPTQEKEIIPIMIGASRLQTLGSIKDSDQKNKNQKLKQIQTYSIDNNKVIGNGTFGVVYSAFNNQTGEKVAIKKVFQDQRYKNRELQMMKEIGYHTNLINLKHYFYTNGDNNSPDELYLNLVMDYIPETLYRVVKYYSKKQKGNFPNILLKLYSYQLIRALGYIQTLGICHRDIKPTNVLVDPRNHSLKMCDFGSAKKLISGEANISYICSRYYRAPELMFMATQYTTSIDIWSVGCVIAEMVLGEPIFAGESSVDQLVEIIKVLGTPSTQQIQIMNQDHQQSKLPQIQPTPWNKVFQNCKVDPLAVDLISKMLLYNPEKRIKPLQALQHLYFKEIKNSKCKINGKNLPELFDFTIDEVFNREDLFKKLVPDWYINRRVTESDQYQNNEETIY